jgi:hypothetical protein
VPGRPRWSRLASSASVAVPVSRGSPVCLCGWPCHLAPPRPGGRGCWAAAGDDLVAHVGVRGEDVVCHHRCFPAETVQEGGGTGLCVTRRGRGHAGQRAAGVVAASRCRRRWRGLCRVPAGCRRWRPPGAGGGLCRVPAASWRSHGFRPLAHPLVGDCTETAITQRFASTRRHPPGRVCRNRRHIAVRVHSPQHPCASARKPWLHRGGRGSCSATGDPRAPRCRAVNSATQPRAGAESPTFVPWPSPVGSAALCGVAGDRARILFLRTPRP